MPLLVPILLFAAAAGGPYDIVIRNGRIIDGTGSPWYAGDVAIRGGRIAAIGHLADVPARRTLDARGMVVAPGFIDMLGQSELTILVNADTIIAEGAALVDYLGMHPVMARSLGVRLSDGAFYEVFRAGTLAIPEVCRKTINFFCTDNRDGEAKLVLVERFDGREMNERVLPLPVSAELPARYNDCERVTVTFSLDDDLILRVFGKGATKSNETSMEVHDLLFALGTEVRR